ncbi:Cocaine esterase [Branchiostoma belcheri]|nr:Cocaine esterase [Branchiostoma belcheri]
MKIWCVRPILAWYPTYGPNIWRCQQDQLNVRGDLLGTGKPGRSGNFGARSTERTTATSRMSLLLPTAHRSGQSNRWGQMRPVTPWPDYLLTVSPWIDVYNAVTGRYYRFSCRDIQGFYPPNGCELSTDQTEGFQQLLLNVDDNTCDSVTPSTETEGATDFLQPMIHCSRSHVCYLRDVTEAVDCSFLDKRLELYSRTFGGPSILQQGRVWHIFFRADVAVSFRADEEVFSVQTRKVFAQTRKVSVQTWKVFAQTRKVSVQTRKVFGQTESIRAHVEGIRAHVEGIRADVEGILAHVKGIRADVEGNRADTQGSTYGPPYLTPTRGQPTISKSHRLAL